MMNSNAIKQLSACLIATNQYQELENLIKKYPGSIDLQYYQCLVILKQGDLKEALQKLKTILQNGNEHEPAKRLAVELLICEASKYIKDGNWKEMSIYLTDALKLAAEFPEMQRKLSSFKNVLPISLLKASDRQKAAEIWEDELRNDPSNYVLVHSLALLYYWWAIDEEGNYKNQLNNNDETNKTSSNRAVVNSNIIVSEKGKLVESYSENGNTSLLDKLWNRTIAYWNLLLNMEEFWEWYKQEKTNIWGVHVNHEDIKEIRNQFIYNKLSNLFDNYHDYYKQVSKDEDYLRHSYYLSFLSIEKKLARYWKDALQLAKDQLKLNIEHTVKRFELIHKIQKVVGSSTCYGTENDCKSIKDCIWKPDCITDRNQDVYLNFPAGYLFFESNNTLLDAFYLVEVLHKLNPKNDRLGQLRVYFAPKGIGKLFCLLEGGFNTNKILENFENLSEQARQSIEGTYLFLLILQKKGNEEFGSGNFEEAFANWEKISKTINQKELRKKIQEQSFNIFFTSFNKKFDESIIELFEFESRKLKKQNKLNEAITILDTALKLTNNGSLREHLAAFCVDLGYEKLRDAKFKQARDNFSKAITVLPGHRGARDGLALAYNNEAIRMKDLDKAFPLFKRAFEYNPNDNVIRKNYAGAYNVKAVAILNSLSHYSYDIQGKLKDAVNLLEQGLCVLNPAFCNGGQMGFLRSIMNMNLAGPQQDQLLQTMLENLKLAYDMQGRIMNRY